eukprot:1223927-Karenia_brevis.AAC.1
MAYLSEHAERVEDAMSSGDPVKVHCAIRPMMARSYATSVGVRSAEGTPASNILEAKKIFKDHFSSLFSADASTMSDCARNHLQKSVNNSRLQNVCIVPQNFISLGDLTLRLSKLGPKAVGENGLGGELLALFPSQFAK